MSGVTGYRNKQRRHTSILIIVIAAVPAIFLIIVDELLIIPADRTTPINRRVIRKMNISVGSTDRGAGIGDIAG